MALFERCKGCRLLTEGYRWRITRLDEEGLRSARHPSGTAGRDMRKGQKAGKVGSVQAGMGNVSHACCHSGRKPISEIPIRLV